MTANKGGAGGGGDFSHHQQEHNMSCGPVCLRMIAEWLSRTCVLEKELRVRRWSRTGGMSLGLVGHKEPSDSGVRYERARKQLEKVLGTYDEAVRVSLSPPAKTPPKELTHANTVLLMLSPSYHREVEDRRDAPVTNVGHWTVVRRAARLKKAIHAGRPAPADGNEDMRDVHWVCTVHDPAQGLPYYQSWPSIVGQHVEAAFLVTRSR